MTKNEGEEVTRGEEVGFFLLLCCGMRSGT